MRSTCADEPPGTDPPLPPSAVSLLNVYIHFTGIASAPCNLQGGQGARAGAVARRPVPPRRRLLLRGAGPVAAQFAQLEPLTRHGTEIGGPRARCDAQIEYVGTGRPASTAGPTACRLRAVPSWLLQTLPTAFLSPDGDRWRDVPQEKGGKKHQAGSRCAAAGAAWPKSSGSFPQPSGRAPGPQVPPAGLPLPQRPDRPPSAQTQAQHTSIDSLERFERGRLRPRRAVGRPASRPAQQRARSRRLRPRSCAVHPLSTPPRPTSSSTTLSSSNGGHGAQLRWRRQTASS